MKHKTNSLKHKKGFFKASRLTFHLSRAFTLVEILVVATIISLLAVGGLVSYSQFTKSSRDARRKSDLEQIRAAIEMYRSNNNYYPTTSNVNTACAGTTGITDASNTYLSLVPKDPKCTSYVYYYNALPNGCTNVSPSFCTDYTLAAQLETTSSCTSAPGGSSCGTSPNKPCNYCLGSYGQK